MDHQPPQPESLPHLPSELIILEILPRLPVKSLLRFRCVSKLWLSLISSQKFIKSHLKKSSNNKDYTFHSLIAQSSGPPFTFKNCSVRSLLLRDPVANGTSVDFPVKNTPGSIYVVGSCNGLICIILDFAQMYIWNPSTRKSKKLSDSGFIRTQRWYTVYGFGYDETSDDYNVVIMFREFNHVKIETKVYSLKSDRWRRIEDFPGFFPIHCKQGKYVDGKLHWPGYSGKEAWGVVSFDLAQAKYGEVKLPISGERVSHPVLGVLGKCLCVMYKHQWFSVDLWLMKEYGVMESWIKILTFTSFEIDSLVPLCISRDGEVLIQFGSTFKWYNLQDGSAGYDTIMSMNKRCDATIYVESLVSPNANDEHERQDG